MHQKVGQTHMWGSVAKCGEVGRSVEKWAEVGIVIHVPVFVCNIGKLKVDRSETGVYFGLLMSFHLNLRLVRVVTVILL